MMYIQYGGFKVNASFRVYNFDVIDTGATRQFAVQVPSEAFRPASLMLQDGPGICFARLEHELQRETQELPTQAHLTIAEQDIREYREQHCADKQNGRKREKSGASPAVQPRNRW